MAIATELTINTAATAMDMANAITQSYTSSNVEKTNAQRRYGDAAKQYAMLLKTGNAQNNDFATTESALF